MTDDGYTIPIEAPPALVPLSPPAAREAMVADEMAIYARAGVPLSSREAERMIARDLAIYEAAGREAPSTWTPSAPTPDEAQERQAERVARKNEALASVAASQPGMVDAVPSAVLQAESLPTDRWSYAKGRIARLLRGMVANTNPKIAAASCDQPALAEEVIVLHWQVAITQKRRQLGTWGPPPKGQRNPFWGVSRKDFGRVFQRLVEDICDRSTACPGYGPWLVPK